LISFLRDFTKPIIKPIEVHSEFEQLLHLQYSPHFSPTLKHSQYFLTHPVFRQLHPLIDNPFCPKFKEDRIIMSSMALALSSLNSSVLWQASQLQFWQKDPEGWEKSYLGQNTRNKAWDILISCNYTLFGCGTLSNHSWWRICVSYHRDNYLRNWGSRKFG